MGADRPGRPRSAKLALTGIAIAISLLALATPGAAHRLAHRAAPSPSPSGSATVNELATTIAPLKTTSHDTTMTTHDSAIKGSVDPARHAASMVATAGGLRIDQVVNNGQVWLKMDLGPEANGQLGISKDKWLKLDPAKLTNPNNLPIRPDGSDPIDMPGILAGVTTVTKVDSTHFKGTLDLSKVTGHNTPDADEVTKAGAAAKSTPYALATDSQGRISSFTVDTRGFDPALTVNIRFTKYGAASPIVDPPTSVNAPDSVYSVFN